MSKFSNKKSNISHFGFINKSNNEMKHFYFEKF